MLKTISLTALVLAVSAGATLGTAAADPMMHSTMRDRMMMRHHRHMMERHMMMRHRRHMMMRHEMHHAM